MALVYTTIITPSFTIFLFHQAGNFRTNKNRCQLGPALKSIVILHNSYTILNKAAVEFRFYNGFICAADCG